MPELFLRAVENTGAAVTISGRERPHIRPANDKTVADVIKTAAAHSQSLMITGGGTFSFTVSQDFPAVLDMTGLDSDVRLFPDDLIAECPAGVTCDQFMIEAAKLGFTVPARGAAAPGQTCAGAWMSGPLGPWGVLHNELHRAVIGVTGVDSRGETVRFGGRTAKNVTGYDMVWFLGGTLGMFFVVTSLIVKIQPAPQDRGILSLTFHSLDGCVSFLNRAMTGGRRIVRTDLWAQQGLSGSVNVSIAVEGMASIVSGEIDALRGIARDCGAGAIDTLTVGDWLDGRRRIVSGLSLPHMVQVAVPVSAAGGFLEQINRITPDVPVWGSPLQGRYFLIPADGMPVKPVDDAVRSVGGKNPFPLSHLLEGNIGDLFSPAEKKIISSLKRELDPGNIFNPHLRLT